MNEAALREALAKALEKYGEHGLAEVSAGMVASALFGEGPISHSERIRVGQALSRLARQGKVRRVERKGHESFGWALVEGDA